MNKLLFILLTTVILLLSGCATINQADQGIPATLSENSSNEQNKQDLTQLSEPAESQNHEEAISQIEKDIITQPDEYDYTLIFPSDSYPETALHIYSAIENGASDVCTIDRNSADENRKQSLKGIDTKEGYDRDEWPMAMCAEGGEGASVAYIDPSDNRGAGSWVGHQLSAYEDGERILFIVEKPQNLFGNTQEQPSTEKENEQITEQQQSNSSNTTVTYKNCTEVKAAGAAPLYAGDPGYSKKLDRDGDGIACEL